jgi:hypothetical protein
MVDSSIDNMLKITNDGHKLVLDQRLMNPLLSDDESSKSANCVEKVFQIWEDTKAQKSAQLIFCDLSTPKGDGTFNVYADACPVVGIVEQVHQVFSQIASLIEEV